MARQLHLEYEGAFYHVTARGNERRKVYFSEYDTKYDLEGKVYGGVILGGTQFIKNALSQLKDELILRDGISEYI